MNSRPIRHPLFRWLPAVISATALMSASGCIPSRLRTGALFVTDRVRPPVVRVLLPTDNPHVAVRGEGRYVIRIAIDTAAEPLTFSTEGALTIRRTGHWLEVFDAHKVALARGAIGLTIHPEDPDQRLWLDGRPYYGCLVIGTANAKLLQIVNRLNLDRYLEGVLTPELGERRDDEFEAVRAQAVASRTYALKHLGQYGVAPYDLRADVADQIYVGASQPRAWVDSAVTTTQGEVITYAGHLIDAYYHSTCGGRTDAIEDIWTKPPRPYLVSVDDDTFCQWSKYTSWTEQFSGRVLLANLRSYRRQLATPAIGDFHRVDSISLGTETPGGRRTTMTVVTPAGRWTIFSDKIRWALGRPSRPGTILPSSRFVLTLRRDKHGKVVGATANGSGYGHGVGICQCGMIGRARAGESYVSILTTYYPGVLIERVYGL
ncbi:MAG: SpoIID/LytB domain-containing protein [Candidatus Zixiibacteriota bacterium]